MTNKEKAQSIVCFHCNQQSCDGPQTVKSCPKNKEVNNLLEMAKWKDENPIVTANLFRQCISMLNDICYEQGTGIDETDIEYVIKVKKLP